MTDILNIVGLVFNLVGAVLLAFSVRVESATSKNQGVSIKILGQELTQTKIDRHLFRWGVALLICGFFSQLLAIILPKIIALAVTIF